MSRFKWFILFILEKCWNNLEFSKVQVQVNELHNKNVIACARKKKKWIKLNSKIGTRGLLIQNHCHYYFSSLFTSSYVCSPDSMIILLFATSVFTVHEYISPMKRRRKTIPGEITHLKFMSHFNFNFLI